MKTLTDFNSILRNIQYKDGWYFLVEQKDSNHFLVIQVNGVDSKTGTPLIWRSRKWYLSPYMTETEIVQTALLAVKTAEEHEIRERFKYENELVFGPHIPIDSLVSLCENTPEDKRNDSAY